MAIIWYTFFHEAGHILLHSKKEVFVDIEDNDDTSAEIERQADQFARDLLIPPDALKYFIQTRNPTREGKPFFEKEDICTFAAELGIAPSIVVGRLQHDRVLEFKYKNELRTRLEWDSGNTVTIKQRAEMC